MAFVEKAGSRFAVKQGNTGKTLSTFGSQKKANEEVAKLHKQNNPASANRGGSAKSNQGKVAMKAKTTGRKTPSKPAKARKGSSASRSRKTLRKHKR